MEADYSVDRVVEEGGGGLWSNAVQISSPSNPSLRLAAWSYSRVVTFNSGRLELDQCHD